MKKTIMGLGVLALALAAPAFAYPLLLVNIVCFAMIACGYNLLVGYTKCISFGHTAYVGTLWGPVLGAGVVVFLHHYLAERAPSLVYGVTGILFIVCVLVFRRGIVGEIQARFGLKVPSTNTAPSVAVGEANAHSQGR